MLFLNAFVRSRLTYSAQTWNLNITQADKVNSCYYGMLRRMIKNGFIRKDGKDAKHQKKTDDDDQDTEFRYRYTNSDLLHICKTTSITDYTAKLQANYLAHVARRSNLNTS